MLQDDCKPFEIVVGFRLSQSLNLTRRFPVALQNTIRLRYDLGDLATVSWEDWDRDLALYLVLTCRSPCCNWPRCLGPGSTTPATTINANLCNLVLVFNLFGIGMDLSFTNS